MHSRSNTFCQPFKCIYSIFSCFPETVSFLYLFYWKCIANWFCRGIAFVMRFIQIILSTSIGDQYWWPVLVTKFILAQHLSFLFFLFALEIGIKPRKRLNMIRSPFLCDGIVGHENFLFSKTFSCWRIALYSENWGVSDNIKIVPTAKFMIMQRIATAVFHFLNVLRRQSYASMALCYCICA